MVTSDFTPEVEIRPFRACAMKNAQYKEIGVEEHDGDVRF